MATPALQDNTPAAGSISWPEFHIQYEGEGYTVPAGSTAERWTWWRFNGGTPALEYGAEVPQDLTEDDLVLFGNKNGTGVRVQSATLIDGELLVDGTVMASKLDAKAVTTEHLMADDALINGLLQAKSTISEAVETEGLTIAGDQTWNKTTGFTIPEVVNFPPNNLLDAYVWAKLIARSLTIENFFKLRGRNNEYSAGAKVVMADAITDPDGAPSQEAAWEQVTQLSIPEGAGNLRGIVCEDLATKTWVALLINLGSSGNDCQLIRFVDGVEVKRSPIMTVTDGYGGFCRSSTGYYYVCSNPSWYDNASQGGVNAESFWNIEVVTPDLNTKLGFYQPVSRQTGISSPGVRFTSDDTQIYAYSSSKIMIAGRVAGSIDRLHGLTWDAAMPDGRADSVSITLSDRIPPNESFQGLTKGKPPGNDQLTSAPVAAGYWTAWYGGIDPFLNGVDIPAVERAYGKSVRGAWHDGTYHYTLDSAGKVYRYEKARLTGQVGYNWRDTTDPKHETAVSPPTTINVPRGAGVLVTPDAPPFTGDPDSPDTSFVFARVASGDPWRNHGAGAPTKFIGVIDGAAAIFGSEGIASFATAGITPFEWVSQKLDQAGKALISIKGNGEAWIRNVMFVKPHLRRRRAGTQLYAVTTWENHSYDTAMKAEGIEVTSNTTFTVKRAGDYDVYVHTTWDATSVARRLIDAILVNGTRVARSELAAPAGNNAHSSAHTNIVRKTVTLAVNDTIQAAGWQSGGSSATNLNTLGDTGSEAQTFIEITHVSD